MPDYAKDDLAYLDMIYLVMEYIPYDMKSLLQNKSVKLELDHVIVLAYNLLLSLDFLQ